jgi:hypothetical protein
MPPKKLGEIKEPFIVWLFITLYLVIGNVFGGSSKGALPPDVTVSLVVNLLVTMAIG